MKTWKKLKDNPDLWDRYLVREKVTQAIRAFFETERFHEVEVPTIVAHPAAESYIDVFETTLLNRQRRPTSAYLSTSPEVPLKKLLVAGIGNCYSLTKSFRNMETQSALHNPEFTILEWYRVEADYTDTMRDCERLVYHICKTLNAADTFVYQGKMITMTPPWDRMSVAQAFKKYADINFDEFFFEVKAREIAAKKGYRVERKTTWEELYNQIFLNEIEPHLGMVKPVLLYDFPAITAALCRKKPSDPRYKERFELYIAGLELGDAYSELTDWKEQEKEFKKELEGIKRTGKTQYEYDRDFIEALKAGLPVSSGMALGVDRLIMLLTNVTNIADILFFPAKELFEDGNV